MIASLMRPSSDQHLERIGDDAMWEGPDIHQVLSPGVLLVMQFAYKLGV